MTIRKKDRYKEITKARKILHLPEQANMKEIKEKYKEFVPKWHSDKGGENGEQCNERRCYEKESENTISI